MTVGRVIDVETPVVRTHQTDSLFRLALRNFWFLFGGIWLLVGLPFLVSGLYLATQSWRYQPREVADGMVLTKSLHRDSNDGGVRHGVTYRFTTAAGQIVEGTASVKGEVWERLKERGVIRVTYAPQSPGSHEVEGEAGDWVLNLAFTMAGAVFGGGGAVILARALAQMRRRIRLDREGVMADAEVVEVVPSRVSINRMAQARIRYRYRDHYGQVHEGRTSMQPAEDAERWRTGDIAAVRFDRTRPQESIWIGRT